MAFTKGQSGNPAGRPKKPRDAQVSRLRADLLRDAPAILEALKAAALAGDPMAGRLLLDRCLPALRPVDLPAPIALPPDLAGASAAILAALASGSLSPDQGATLASVLGSLARVRESAEFEARLAQLEAAINERTPTQNSR